MPACPRCPRRLPTSVLRGETRTQPPGSPRAWLCGASPAPSTPGCYPLALEPRPEAHMDCQALGGPAGTSRHPRGPAPSPVSRRCCQPCEAAGRGCLDQGTWGLAAFLGPGGPWEPQADAAVRGQRGRRGKWVRTAWPGAERCPRTKFQGTDGSWRGSMSSTRKIAHPIIPT